jgi:hypothetical protein
VLHDAKQNQTSALFHTRQKALKGKERRSEVSVDGRTPSFFARIFQRAGGSKAPSRVRDKNVYRSELTFDSEDERSRPR